MVRNTDTAVADEAPPLSFDAFFAAESETLFRRMWLVTRNRHEAEEVVQDAFLSLLERWDRVSGLPDPTGYLYRTAFNAWKKRTRRAALATKNPFASPPEPHGFEAADARIVVDQALDQLSPRQRAAIVLTELLGYSSEDAGEILGVRPVTARVLASQARGTMKSWLERESERVALPTDTADRVLERGRRKARNRRAAALGVGALLFLVVISIIRAAVPDREPQPAIPTPTPTTPGSVAGSYSVRLTGANDVVRRFGVGGNYTMRLDANGDLELSGPKGFDLPGDPITFDVSRGRLTTDAFVGRVCDAPGTYQVRLDAGILMLAPVDEDCELRRVLLSTAPWTADAGASPLDRLEGDWTTTFSCERMVSAVRRAPIEPGNEVFWLEAMSRERGSEDPTDPCAGTDEIVAFTFRFDDGRLLIFDRNLVEGFDGRYELQGNRITFRDGDDNNIDGRYRAAFVLVRDRLTFDLLGRAGRDAFFVATWESASFVRNA
jgi:RNA polymerase sigma factor (sigma-70 family)